MVRRGIELGHGNGLRRRLRVRRTFIDPTVKISLLLFYCLRPVLVYYVNPEKSSDIKYYCYTVGFQYYNNTRVSIYTRLGETGRW